MIYKFYNDNQIALIYRITALIFEETTIDINPNDLSVIEAVEKAMRHVHNFEALSLFQELKISMFKNEHKKISVDEIIVSEDQPETET